MGRYSKDNVVVLVCPHVSVRDGEAGEVLGRYRRRDVAVAIDEACEELKVAPDYFRERWDGGRLLVTLVFDGGGVAAFRERVKGVEGVLVVDEEGVEEGEVEYFNEEWEKRHKEFLAEAEAIFGEAGEYEGRVVLAEVYAEGDGKIEWVKFTEGVRGKMGGEMPKFKYANLLERERKTVVGVFGFEKAEEAEAFKGAGEGMAGVKVGMVRFSDGGVEGFKEKHGEGALQAAAAVIRDMVKSEK